MMYKPRSGPRIASFVGTEPACIVTTRTGSRYANGLRGYLHHIRHGFLIDYIETNSPESLGPRDPNLRGRKVVFVVPVGERGLYREKAKQLVESGAIDAFMLQDPPKKNVTGRVDPSWVQKFAKFVGIRVRNDLGGQPSIVLGVKSGGIPYAVALRDFLTEGHLDVGYAEVTKEPKLPSQLRREQVDGRVVIVADDAISTGDTYGAISDGLEELKQRYNVPRWLYVVERDFQGIADFSARRVTDLDVKAERERTRILVVDNDHQTVRVVTRMLEGEGYKTDTSTEVNDAINRIQQNPYDLVISDVMMGNGQGGLEVLREAKNTGVKIIPMTGLGQGDKASLLTEVLSLQGFIPKPFTKDVLASTVEEKLKEF